MSFTTYSMGKFKRGQFDITEECRKKSLSGKIVTIFDGDVTTYIYERPLLNDDMQRIKSLIDNAFAIGGGSYIATFVNDDENIYVDFQSGENHISGLTLIEVEKGEYVELLTAEDKESVLTSSASFQSMEELLKSYPSYRKNL